MTKTPNNMRKVVRDAGRREILQVVEEMVLERGQAYVTMAGVARRARCAVGTLYRYFPSRDAMLEELIASFFWKHLLCQAETRDGTIREQLHAFLERCAHWAHDHAAMLSALGLGNTVAGEAQGPRLELQLRLCAPGTALGRIVDAMVADAPPERRVDVYTAQIMAAAIVGVLIRVCASEHHGTRTAEHVYVAARAICAATTHPWLEPQGRYACLALAPEQCPSGNVASGCAGK